MSHRSFLMGPNSQICLQHHLGILNLPLSLVALCQEKSILPKHPVKHFCSHFLYLKYSYLQVQIPWIGLIPLVVPPSSQLSDAHCRFVAIGRLSNTHISQRSAEHAKFQPVHLYNLGASHWSPYSLLSHLWVFQDWQRSPWMRVNIFGFQ